MSYVNSGDTGDNTSGDSLTMLPTYINDNGVMNCRVLSLHGMFVAETGNCINPTVFTGNMSCVHYASNLCIDSDIIVLSLMYYDYNHY